MRPAETTVELAGFDGRAAGSDAERRAARWAAEELSQSGRVVRLEPFWCRPNWALAHAWHVGLGLVGSLVSVHEPRMGGLIILIAALAIVADVLLGISPGRRLTPERASQNVVSTPRSSTPAKPLRLIITANLDGGRSALVYRQLPRRLTASMAALAGRRAPGWLGWLMLAHVVLLAVAILRLQGAGGAAIGIVQVVPTISLVLALALLLEAAGAEVSPAANDNASGSAVAIALARALDVAPPRELGVEVVLQGAGDVFGIGLRRYLRSRKRELRPANSVVLGIAPCGAGSSRYWVSDGQLVPLRYSPRLRKLAAAAASEDPALQASPHRGRSASPALPGRAAQLPAIAIGCLDELGLVPRSHQASDTPETIDEQALDHTLELGLLLADAIDAFLVSARPTQNAAQPTGAAQAKPA